MSLGLHFGSKKNHQNIDTFRGFKSFFEPKWSHKDNINSRLVYIILWSILRTLEWWDEVLQKRLAWALLVINSRVLSANRVDFGIFLFINFPILLPPPPSQNELREIFDLVDADHGGSISTDELHELMIQLGLDRNKVGERLLLTKSVFLFLSCLVFRKLKAFDVTRLKYWCFNGLY